MTPSCPLTVAAAIAGFLDYMKAAATFHRRRPATERFYRHQLAHLARIVHPDTPIDAVDASMLMRGPHTNHFLRACRRLWRYHRVDWPAEVIVPAAGQRERTLTPQEFRRLRQAVAGQVRWILWLIYQTGMRPDEARELRWHQVREEESHLILHRFKARDRRHDGLKTRIVPLPAVVCRAFAWYRRKLEPTADVRVFENRLGRPWTNNSLRLAVRRARRKARLPRDVVAYTLRHTYATRAVRAGIRDTTLAAILGHTSLNTTMRYLHRTAADLVAAIGGLNRRRQGKE